MDHVIVASRRRARVGLLLGLVVVALGIACLRPLSASAAAQDDPGKPGAGSKDGKEKEENGGDLVFDVVSKTQKYSVLYSHEVHLGKGIECEECHEKIFKKKMNANHFKMADINRGQFCGTCHNASPAADVKHAAFAPKNNCKKCHTLRIREPDPK